MPWVLLACAAWSADRELARGDLVLDRTSLAVEVTRMVLPDPVQAPPEDPADRVCRASAIYQPGPGGTPGRVTFTPIGCHPSIAPAVSDAVSRWALQLRPNPTDQQDILVAWFVFPPSSADAPSAAGPESAGPGPVRLALSVVPGTEILAIPEGIEVASFGHPTKRAPVLRGAPGSGSCAVVMKIDEAGTPYNFDIEGCSEAAAGGVRDGLLDWKFSPSTIGLKPTRVRVPLTVTFSPGGAAVRLLPSADDDMRYLSDDPNAAREQAEVLLPPVPPLPEGAPLLTVHHSYYAPVEIFTMPLPGPAAAPAR
ncbi:MAG: hypothetical protein H0V89_02550, partial [Deltaproteobacteria bacterium]|nr:hypothetical protein [Deltaproteobacteria bacterium]